jgi:hypothetical protein
MQHLSIGIAENGIEGIGHAEAMYLLRRFDTKSMATLQPVGAEQPPYSGDECRGRYHLGGNEFPIRLQDERFRHVK